MSSKIEIGFAPLEALDSLAEPAVSNHFQRLRREMRIVLAAMVAGFSISSFADDYAVKWQQLEEQNRLLREQVQTQNKLIQELTGRVSDLERKTDTSSAENAGRTEPGSLTRNVSSENVRISGEGGVAFFHQGSQGQFPNSEFRIDEAKLFLDAKVWDDIYFFVEGNLFYREQYEDHPDVGELYVDFENLSRFWHQDRLVNLRFGRIDIPFGDEYLSRDAIDNPLISHSLSDFWGVDEGIEIYGGWKKLEYVLAVQNGSHPMLRDGDSDKAVIARIGFNPSSRLHLSLSGMRTGNLDVSKDGMSELWFGSGFFRQLGAADSTTKFHAELVEGDSQFFWKEGYLKSAGGYAHFDDNDAVRDNERDLNFYYLEALQNLPGKFYAATRWSQIFAPEGYPLVGGGDFGRRFYGTWTENLWRWSLGVGYRWNRDLVMKLEYTLNGGKEFRGASRNHEDFLGAEAALRF